MKKYLFAAMLLSLTACTNDWSHSGVPDVYEGQSKQSVLQALEKNHWVIVQQKELINKALVIEAYGPPTKQFAKLFAADCRKAILTVFEYVGLQRLETTACDK
ncbi:hypothetical protein EDC45_1764 [Mesocricetibacter intestinalis]|uniref:Lipoprotein n=1 Tax=Mesocricetibacter intestinalis TaxID=1521930 RepID=A0A4R6V7D1_9PAST|nr:hypothetical protein [Mesocricetibacter intestinalis]TDQ56805.1 hypothetical protein EDC45_1764 [Mesocricetibacter intestinalis]